MNRCKSVTFAGVRDSILRFSAFGLFGSYYEAMVYDSPIYFRPVYAIASLLPKGGLIQNVISVAGLEYMTGVLFNEKHQLWEYKGRFQIDGHIDLFCTMIFGVLLTASQKVCTEHMLILLLLCMLLYYISRNIR